MRYDGTVTFLPQLLNWQAAAIAAGVAVPALLLLYFLKLRRTPQPVGSTLLWKKAIQDLQVNSPFQRLRRNILLLLQMLALLALLLALARPVSEGTPVAGAKTVILIDHSASMNARDSDEGGGGTRLEAAKERAKALVNTMGRGDQAMVVQFSDKARIVQAYTGDTALLKGAIDAITPSDRPTSLAEAYTLSDANMGANAAERLRDDAENRADIFLFSDGRVPPSEAADLSLRGALNYERIGSDEAGNLAIVAASVKRNYEEPTQAQVFARVENFGPQPVEAAVRVSVATIDEDDLDASLDFRPVGALPAALNVPPARWTDDEWLAVQDQVDPAAADTARRQTGEFQRRDSIDVQLELPRAAVVRIELVGVDDYGVMYEDALEADNLAFISVPPPEPLKAVLVTEGNYYLDLLFRTQGLDDPQIITPQQYEALLEEGGADDFDVTVFDRYSPTRVPEAGTFVYTGGLPPTDATEVRQVTSENDVGLFYEANATLDWDRDHPMLRGLSLGRLWVADGRILSLPLGAQLLIEGDKGPMLVLERNGPRTNVIFSFDLVQITWPRQKTFPIFGYQMFQYLAAAEDVRVRESVKPGEAVGVPQNLVSRANLGEGDGVRLVGPGGYEGAVPGRSPEVAINAGGGLTLSGLDRVGVYKTEPAVPQFSHIAVSLLDPTESNLLPAYTDPGNLSGSDAVQVATGEASDTSGVRDVEWWWWLVAIAAVVLTVEWIVYTRRVAA